MSKLRISVLKAFNTLGDYSGCHQIPERSFRVKGYLFPICARCTGVFLGQLLALFTGIFGFRLPFWLAFSMLGIMGADWFLQYIGLWLSTNQRRFFTGLLGGFGLFQLYFLLLDWAWAIIKTHIV